MNPYINSSPIPSRLVNEAQAFPLGGFPPLPRPHFAPDAPKALFFAPHPDDETIVGALALRILREARMNLINVAVTQGSKRERQAERFVELQNACHYLGYGVQTTGPNGLGKSHCQDAAERTASFGPAWSRSSPTSSRKHQPRVILFPHERDWNGTHIGIHHLVMDALRQMPASFECYTVETEFWGAMDDPNLMVEVSEQIWPTSSPPRLSMSAKCSAIPITCCCRRG